MKENECGGENVLFLSVYVCFESQKKRKNSEKHMKKKKKKERKKKSLFPLVVQKLSFHSKVNSMLIQMLCSLFL